MTTCKSFAGTHIVLQTWGLKYSQGTCGVCADVFRHWGQDRVAVFKMLQTTCTEDLGLTHLDWKFIGKLRQGMGVRMVTEGKGKQVQAVPKKIKTEGCFLSALPGEPGLSLR